jgi:hypothetical protein
VVTKKDIDDAAMAAALVDQIADPTRVALILPIRPHYP